MDRAGERRSNWTLAAFAAPCLPLAALGLPLVVHLPAYYHSEIGLPLQVVNFAWTSIRLLDLAFDPMFGGVMDRTHTRWGRFRFWFALGCPIVMAATLMLFVLARPGVGAEYLWAGLIVIYAGQSITSLAQMAWAAVLTPSYNERSRIYNWWQAANVVGMLLVLLIPALLEKFGGFTRAQGVQVMGWFILVLLPLSLGIMLVKVPEPEVVATRDRSGFREYLELFKRPTVRRLLICDILIGTGPAVTGALFFFFFRTIKGFESADAGLLLFFYFTGALVGGPLWTRLAYRLGKHRTLAVAGVAYAAIQSCVFLLPQAQFAPAAALMFVAGLPFSAGPFLLRAMMADVCDEERLATRKDRTGLLYAILTGTVKIGSALAVGVTYGGLGVLGFDDKLGLNNPQPALTGLMVAFTVLPAVLGLAAAAVIFGYPLTAERQEQIRAALADRDAADRNLAEAGPDLGARPRISDDLRTPNMPPGAHPAPAE